MIDNNKTVAETKQELEVTAATTGAAATDETALAVAQEYGFMKPKSEAVKEAMDVNLAGEELSVFDLPRIKMLKDSKMFVSVDDEDDTFTEVTGVIVFKKTIRALFEKPYEESGGDEVPLCSSNDGIFGMGVLDATSKNAPCKRDCKNCTMNIYGTDAKGAGKACKERKLIFIMRPEDVMMPIILDLPPTSIAKIKKYMIRTVATGTPYYGVITKFTIEKCTKGVGYNIIKCTKVGDLTGDMFIASRNLFKKMQESFE